MSKHGADPRFHSLEAQLPFDAENGRESGNDDSKQNLGAEITLREADIKDAAVVENCVEARETFASYINDCKNVEMVEFSSDTESAVEEAEHRVKLAGSQWRSMLRQVGESSAHTPSGILAKARVVDGYFVEHPTHDEIMRVMRSILKDLEGLLQRGID